MSRAALLALFLLIVAMAGCGGSDSEGPAGTEGAPAAAAENWGAMDEVTKAARITRAVEADPDAADAVLEQAGMTIEEFEELMYDIAADPELTAAYESALAR